MTEAAEHPNLAAALAAFQAELPVVGKGQTATIPGKDGRTGYSYRYADLADVSSQAMPILAKHGLSFTSRPRRIEGGREYELVGILRHASGESDEGALPLNGRSAQELGSSITYARRYLLGAMTGLVTDEDDDGARAQQTRERTTVQVDLTPRAREVLAEAMGTTVLQDVVAIWHRADRDGLLDVVVEAMDGSREPLGAILKRHGDSLAGEVQA